jgi:outer membrane protein OmpA-like peptidoglycan-associated protein
VEEGNNNPIPHAVVTYVGRELTGMVADGQGRFTSGALENGEYTLGVSADEYFEGRCNVSVTGPDSAVTCSLRPTPKIGTVVGRVLDADGNGIAGVTVTITPAGRVEGQLPGPATTGADGGFTFEVPAGPYTVAAEHEEYFLRQKQIEVAPRARIEVEMTLAKKPRRAAVTVDAEEIKIRRQIHFENDSAEIKGDSFIILDEVADVMLRNPQIRRVEVQGHTDSRGDNDHNQQLSQARAESVVQYLIDAGVDPRRLEARGYGEDQPIAPNVTSAGRAKNRRVEFHITEQTGASPLAP